MVVKPLFYNIFRFSIFILAGSLAQGLQGQANRLRGKLSQSPPPHGLPVLIESLFPYLLQDNFAVLREEGLSLSDSLVECLVGCNLEFQLAANSLKVRAESAARGDGFVAR